MNIDSLLLEKQKIITRIEQIEDLQKAKLSEQYFTKINSDGQKVRQGPYYNLQRWIDGKNKTVRINRNKVEPYRRAVEGYEAFKELCDQFIDITEKITLLRRQQEESSKKNSQSKSTNKKKPKTSSTSS